MTRPTLLIAIRCAVLVVALWIWPDAGAVLTVPLVPLGLMMPVFGVAPMCPFISDDFNRADSTNLGANWTEVVGDWSIASNKLSIASTNAIVRCNSTAGTNNYQVRCTITTTTAGDKTRVMVNYTDSNNYHCVEVITADTNHPLNWNSYTLIERSGGTETVLSRTAAAAGGLFTRINLGVDSDNRLIVSTPFTTGNSDASIAIAKISPSSAVVALGTGGTLASTALFDDFEIDTPGYSGCQNISWCGNCSHAVHDELQVDLTDTGGSGSINVCNECPLDGTYVLTLQNSETGGNHSCLWQYILPSPVVCGNLPNGGGADAEALVIYGINNGGASPTDAWQFLIQYNSYFYGLYGDYYLDASAPAGEDCDNTPDPSGDWDVGCDSTPAPTITVTAI